MSEAASEMRRQTPGDQHGAAPPGGQRMIHLAANESRYGASPRAQTAYRDLSTDLSRYPDQTQGALRRAIAEHFCLDVERILCGNGSDELISLAVRAVLKPNDEALLSQNGFVMSEAYCAAQGAKLVVAPELDWRVQVGAMLERVTAKTKFCTIANPNNPTGTYLTGAELRELAERLPSHCLLLVDEAYAEYATAADFQTALELVDACPNLMVTRTFSKMYGLPALRIGWCYSSSQVIDRLQQLRSPYNTNAAGLAAAAAAVRDQQFVNEVRTANAQGRDRMVAALTKLGLNVAPSQANFYLVCIPEGQDGTAVDMVRFLQERGIFVRPAAPADAGVRITIGRPEDNETVLQALKEYMQSSDGGGKQPT